MRFRWTTLERNLFKGCRFHEWATVCREGRATICTYPKQLKDVWHAVQDRYGNVLVAELGTNLIHWLSPDLTFQRYLLNFQTGVDKPRIVCLNENLGLLYVSQCANVHSYLEIFRYSYENKPQQPPTLACKLAMNKIQENK